MYCRARNASRAALRFAARAARLTRSRSAASASACSSASSWAERRADSILMTRRQVQRWYQGASGAALAKRAALAPSLPLSESESGHAEPFEFQELRRQKRMAFALKRMAFALPEIGLVRMPSASFNYAFLAPASVGARATSSAAAEEVCALRCARRGQKPKPSTQCEHPPVAFGVVGWRLPGRTGL